ncbi:hypothetical protein [Nonomuraea sp. NPDC005692]|uniref:hypothetical protein n=1 Tax=Nonomuraea sp. NPDC005692 TaxID=3157168 RepID=UPI003407C379
MLSGALVGYARISTAGQLLDSQMAALATAGCIRSYPYIRPQLDDDGGLLLWTSESPDYDGVYAWRY